MTWSQVEASKARRLLANDTLSPEKRQALLGRLEEYELNPQAQQKPTDAASIDESFSKLPARPLDGEAKLPTMAAEIEGGKRLVLYRGETLAYEPPHEPPRLVPRLHPRRPARAGQQRPHCRHHP